MGAETPYTDRADAGRRLADLIGARPERTVVLGLPRGGVPVAAPIAARLGVSVWALPVRKIGAPGRPELAMGAIAAVGSRIEVFRNTSVIAQLGVADSAFEAARRRAEYELAEVAENFGGTPELAGRPVIVVDDGLATGATMLAAVQVLARSEPSSITVAVPVAAAAAVSALRPYAEVVCPWVPSAFVAVGQAYANFGQVRDDEVRALLG